MRTDTVVKNKTVSPSLKLYSVKDLGASPFQVSRCVAGILSPARAYPVP